MCQGQKRSEGRGGGGRAVFNIVSFTKHAPSHKHTHTLIFTNTHTLLLSLTHKRTHTHIPLPEPFPIPPLSPLASPVAFLVRTLLLSDEHKWKCDAAIHVKLDSAEVIINSSIVLVKTVKPTRQVKKSKAGLGVTMVKRRVR